MRGATERTNALVVLSDLFPATPSTKAHKTNIDEKLCDCTMQRVLLPQRWVGQRIRAKNEWYFLFVIVELLVPRPRGKGPGAGV